MRTAKSLSEAPRGKAVQTPSDELGEAIRTIARLPKYPAK